MPRWAPLAGLILLFIAWILIIIFSGIGWNPLGQPWNFTNTGAFGDSFGPLSAAMAAAAAIAALLAWRGQATEIERLKKAEEASRTDALATRDESTLFQLISLLRQIVSTIDIHMQGGKIKTGHDAIAHILSRVSGGGGQTTLSTFEYNYNKYRNDLAHYLRLSYNIFAFIDKSNLRDKRFYAKVVRALFSDSELALIALNCEFGEGKAKFKPLVESYCLLNNLSEERIDEYRLRDYFAAGAFEHDDLAPPK